MYTITMAYNLCNDMDWYLREKTLPVRRIEQQHTQEADRTAFKTGATLPQPWHLTETDEHMYVQASFLSAFDFQLYPLEANALHHSTTQHHDNIIISCHATQYHCSHTRSHAQHVDAWSRCKHASPRFRWRPSGPMTRPLPSTLPTLHGDGGASPITNTSTSSVSSLKTTGHISPSK